MPSHISVEVSQIGATPKKNAKAVQSLVELNRTARRVTMRYFIKIGCVAYQESGWTNAFSDSISSPASDVMEGLYPKSAARLFNE